MEEKDMILKAKKKLIFLLLIYLVIAFACIGFVFFMKFSNEQGEASKLSELVLNDNVEEGQYVKLDIDTLPVLMMPASEKDSQFYYVTDVNNHIYIVSLSDKSFKSIVGTLDQETGKLHSAYQLKGTINNIDKSIKALALSNSFKVFKNNELNSDNFSEYLDEFYINENFVSERVVTLYKSIALIGVFFLVLAFGYVVPAMIKVNKGDFVFDEKTMMQSLGKYIPDRETLIAGIHGVGLETKVKQVFGKCICIEDKLIPSERGTTLEVIKSKYSTFDVYVGITQNYLILSECEVYKHYYEFNDNPDLGDAAVEEIDACIPLEDIGTCFPFAEIQSCVIKNAWMGAVNCSITMKNGTILKLLLPKEGGLGMPHHAEYREAIIRHLNPANFSQNEAHVRGR